MQRRVTVLTCRTADSRLSLPMRLALFVSGAVVIIIPAWELQTAFTEFSPWTIVSGAFLAVAFGIGAVFIACALKVERLNVTWLRHPSIEVAGRSGPFYKHPLGAVGRDFRSPDARGDGRYR